MEGNKEVILVNIGLFPGMPNPEMKLTDDMASQFADLVKSTVGKEPIQPPPRSKLGEFYGFLVQVPDRMSKELGLPAWAIIFRGVLTEKSQREQWHWRDVAGIERFLTRLAYEQGFGELLQKWGVPEPQ